jgi:hypothetical protein
MYALTISVIRGNTIDSPFFNVEPDFRWIYSISNDRELLERFKSKIQAFTPGSYLPWMPIEILEMSQLTQNEIESNNLDRRPYISDKFYINGVVNNNSRLYGTNYYFDEFLPEHWTL